MSSAKMRARMSVTEPAPNGTTIVTRWVGQLCADAGAVETMPAAIMAAAPNISFKIRFIAFLPGLFISRVRRSAPAHSPALSATSSSRLLPKSFSITAAALRPGPPEIEPPGWVVEPVW